MIGSRRNDDRIPLAHQGFLLLDENKFGLSLLDAEELIDIRVHLVADLFERLQAHQHELGVLAGE
jgi:hypothetical protein